MSGLPNVLFITADQFRSDCLSGAGHPVVRTPNLDRLAAGGVSFRRHFANAAPCAPSRASIYTGMYMMNHRAATNGTPLDARHDNVALVARRLGYEPALFGYTDTSVDPRTVAADDPRLFSYEGVLPGFDPVCHLAEGAPDDWLAWLRKAGVDVPDEWRSFVDEPAPGTKWRTNYDAAHSQTAYLTDRVLEFADDATAAGRPWFAHLSYLRPHPPFLAPAPYDTMYDPASVPAPVRAPTMQEEGAQHPLLGVMLEHPLISSPADAQEQRELQATYYGMITEVDDQLGRLFAWLDERGQAENTLVVFTSDHGEMLGDHYLLHKLGWFDASFHVPLIVRGPGVRRRRGRVVDVFTEHVDVLPTICSTARRRGAAAVRRPLARPWLRGETVDGWRNEAHFEFDLPRAREHVLEEAFGMSLEECALAVLRDEHGKYVQFAGHHAFPPIFFDLDDDPAQLVNRAGDPAYAPRSSSTRSACSRGGCATPNARSRA